MLTTGTPTISIGLAVYNGEKFIREAIDLILGQTFTDFELIISDNASTDQTGAICQEYAARDARIHYSRNPNNIGGANNENLTFRLSQGRFFHLAAHDDRIAPDFLEKCLAVLENNPEFVLCHTKVVEINENGETMRITGSRLGEEPKPHQRFGRMTKRFHFCEPIYGLIRSDILRKTRLQLNYVNSDRTLLSELALYGPFHQIQEPLFYKRFHPGNVMINWRTRMAWFDQNFEGKIALPYFIQFADYFTTIRRASLPWQEKLLCNFYMLGPWIIANARYMAKDTAFAIYMLVHSNRWRKQLYQKTNNWS